MSYYLDETPVDALRVGDVIRFGTEDSEIVEIHHDPEGTWALFDDECEGYLYKTVYRVLRERPEPTESKPSLSEYLKREEHTNQAIARAWGEGAHNVNRGAW